MENYQLDSVFQIAFNMIRIPYNQLDEILTYERFIEEGNHINLCINIESVMMFISTIQDLESRLVAEPRFIQGFIKEFVNTVSHYKSFFQQNHFADTKIYFGLGIEFDEEAFEFTKEPVSKGFTILPDPVEFNEPVNGIVRNKNAVSWPKATQDWTTGSDKIQYLGLYYKINEESTLESDSNKYHYELIGVLPLAPAETVKVNERMVLNANTVQIKLSNR